MTNRLNYEGKRKGHSKTQVKQLEEKGAGMILMYGKKHEK